MSQKRPWTIDDVVQQESVSSLQLSPDGSRLLWLRLRPDEEKDKMAPTLMLTDLSSSEHRELTVGRWDIAQPTWSPDGQKIAFRSDHEFPDGMKDLDEDERGSQIWVLDLRGGMPKPVTKVADGVASFDWRSDQEFLLLARIPKTREEKLESKRKDKAQVVEDLERFQETRQFLWSFSIEKSELKRLTDNSDTSIDRFSMAPGGNHVVCWHEVDPRHGAQNDRPPRVVLHGLEDGSASELWPERMNKPQGIVWTNSGSALVTAPRSSIDGENLAAVLDLYLLRIPSESFAISKPVEILTPISLEPDWDRGLAGTPVVHSAGVFLPFADGTRTLWSTPIQFGSGGPGGDAEARRWRMLEVGTTQLLHGLVGRRESDALVGVVGDASTPDAVHRLGLESADAIPTLADLGEVYRPNKGFEQLQIAESEVIRWVGALDEEVEGILYTPTDYEEGRRYPLVLITHGGPHAADQDRFTERWANTPNLYAGRGAFVLKTNYHGSSDYGLAFGESIKGRYYELELIDMIRGIESLIADGKADPDRLGLVGWSNGAILSIAMLTHAEDYAPGHGLKFRACAPGAGDVNWTSDFGNCAFGPSFDRFYVGGNPWDEEARYLEKSPLFRMEDVTTPTIVFFGSEDRAVPTEQGWQHFRALQSIGKAPVRFLLFPGEGHGLSKLSHQRRKLVEELAWFDRFLFGTETAEWPAELSRLDELERVPALRDPRIEFGETVGRTLVPEMVPVRIEDQTLLVSRFEVTTAQWTSLGDEQAPDRDPNLPATGMTATEAARDRELLSERTGRRFRLLTRKERESLKGSSDENTLARWAGYSPNPDEASEIEERLRQLDPETVLWRSGSGRATVVGEGRDRQLLYDLGGNAAEWVRDGDEVVAVGPCVARAVDDSVDQRRFPLRFIGLRVVEER